MRAEDTIQVMMNRFPELYFNRQKCLDTLFCVYGHEYVWLNGEICDETLDCTAVPKQPIIKAEPTEKCKEEEEKYLLLIEKTILKGLSDMVPSKWYPISQYSLINRVPADIKPDWLELLNECKALLKEDGIVLK